MMGIWLILRVNPNAGARLLKDWGKGVENYEYHRRRN